jgi:hypothetical protein
MTREEFIPMEQEKEPTGHPDVQCVGSGHDVNGSDIGIPRSRVSECGGRAKAISRDVQVQSAPCTRLA